MVGPRPTGMVAAALPKSVPLLGKEQLEAPSCNGSKAEREAARPSSARLRVL